ncbi:MAG TPA: 1-deoxy-D-xylulose-5-phosphate reductoisomerase [Planctomycetota bacterium]|nr:1-deoxy-D-xylulose-5-phosphate reductoisomerase [Planctomycetota bacterium]
MTDHRARALTVLGATGSIGVNTLKVAAHLGIPVHAVTANGKAVELAALAREARAKIAVVADEKALPALRDALAGSGIRAAAGVDALEEVAAAPETGAVVTAIVGAAGLKATVAAVRAGKRCCIANKEPLVMAGRLITRLAAQHGAEILPVDSEHSAIFQCLEGHRGDAVTKLILTGSGGPLRTVRDLEAVTCAQALKHPTWTMGPKITIDSATLMNKSLEIIEARWLFAIEVDRIEVLIHPQSVVHSMVHYGDGSVMAQLGRPDMRTPIQYALTWPRHVDGPVAAPDFASLGALTFEAPDPLRFPSLTMAYEAARADGVAPTVMNAANEMAVARFLAGCGRFTDIFRTVERALARAPRCVDPGIDDIIAADADVRASLA